MGIINLSAEEDLLKGITLHRPDAAVPFAGRYRLIDFILSSMVNAGIKNISIFTKNKYRALVDHLQSGKDWDLDRKRDGLFMFHPGNLKEDTSIYKGFLQSLYNNLDYIYKSKQEYVVISDANLVCNFDFEQVLNFHLKNKADITIVYREKDKNKEIEEQFFNRGLMLDLGENNQIADMIEIEADFSISKKRRLFNKKFNKRSVGIYMMAKSLLLDLINASVARGYYDLVKDGFIKNLATLNICGYRHQGYLAKIDSIESYHQHSLDLLNQEVWQDLFFNPGLIYTKVKDGPPAKYMKNAKVNNSLVANACIIDGVVENSILFRRVKVHKGALIKNSIIMQKTEIEQNVVLENVILDKEVRITKGKRLKGEPNYPVVVGKKTVI